MKRKPERQRNDLGTPEAIKRRAQFVLDPKSAQERLRFDPALTTNPIDVLWMWGKITTEQYSAAQRLAVLGREIFGVGWPQAVNLNRVDGLPQGREADMSQYRHAWSAISKQGMLSRYECERMVRFGQFPGMGSSDDAQNMRDYLKCGGYRALMQGLSALADWYERREAA